MAFYTSRVDDSGNEIEIRQSGRSLASSIKRNVNRLNISARSFDTRPGVRYVNSAAYIEKKFSLIDITSHETNKKNLAMSETQSDIVPPLDLESEDNYPPSPRDYTFSYRQHYEPAKIKLKPDKAYETWLSAKRKLLSDEAVRRKKAEKQKCMEIEERQRLSKEKYDKWLDNKTRQQQSSLSQQSTISSNFSSKTTNSSEVSEKLPIRSQISDEETRARLEEWERTKRLKEERRRMLKRQEEQRRQELAEQRRQMAAEAWEKWLADAEKKPKPVPLNRGIFTLRGTISDIYVNPNEWQLIMPTKEEK